MSDHPRDLPPALDAIPVSVFTLATIPAFAVDARRLDALAREMSERLGRRVPEEEAFERVLAFARAREEELTLLVRAFGSAESPLLFRAMLTLALAHKDAFLAGLERDGAR